MVISFQVGFLFLTLSFGFWFSDLPMRLSKRTRSIHVTHWEEICTNADFLSMGHTDGFSGLGKSYRQIAISEGEKQFTAMEPNKKIIIEHRNGFKYSMCYVWEFQIQCEFLYSFSCVTSTVIAFGRKILVSYKVKPKTWDHFLILYTFCGKFPFLVAYCFLVCFWTTNSNL